MAYNSLTAPHDPAAATGRLAALREQVRDWLQTNVPRDWRADLAGCDQKAFVDAQHAWFEKLVAAGFATPHWTAQWPGGGRSLEEQKIISEEIARADAPRLTLYFISLFHAASTLFEWGSPEQQARHLPAILAGEIWCQGFSEPNAGSDLAAVATRADRRGDHYIVSGQKCWSTMAQYADRCLLLARTSTDQSTSKALTYFLLDMKSPGITVRPIRQITGDDEFAEIFLDEVQIPIFDRIGDEGQGWAVAQSTLASERGLTLMELSYRMRSALGRIASQIDQRDALWLDRFGRLICRVEALCHFADSYLEKRIDDSEEVGDASLIKLYYAWTLRDYTVMGLDCAGLAGLEFIDFTRGGSQETGNWPVDFMNSFAWSIAGGSNEIQRNIISERMLLMPREHRATMQRQGA